MAIFKGVFTAFVVSFCSIPLLRSALKHNEVSQFLPMFLFNYSLLITAAMFFAVVLPPNVYGPVTSKRNEIYYMCCLFMCTCVAGMCFQSWRLNLFWKKSKKKVDFFKYDEPFVLTPFGMSSQIWSDIINYFLYIAMIYMIDNCISYRNLALYWSSGTLTNQLITLFGAVTGRFSRQLQYSEVVRVLYLLAAIWVMYKLLVLKPRVIKKRLSNTDLKLLDAFLIISLAFYCVYGVIRGVAALNGKQTFIANYIKNYEPYISDPSRFGATWVLHTAVYGVPLHMAMIRCLLQTKCPWIIDTSIIYAGSLVQGTFVYMTYSLYPSSEKKFRSPADNFPMVLALNVGLVAIAHILMYRCLSEPGYFLNYCVRTTEKRC